MKNREPLPSYAMEMSDEYQDMGNPGGGVAVVNIPMAHHQHSPDSPLVSVFIFFFFSILFTIQTFSFVLTKIRKTSSMF